MDAEPITPDRLAITWNDQLVGWIASPYADMPHDYGRWMPAESLAATEFLEALRRAVDQDEGLQVVLAGHRNGIVYVHPDDNKGEIVVRWIF